MTYQPASYGLPLYFIPMLDDADRNLKYELAIKNVIHQFKEEQGRSPHVIDFGCGTGMLSIFALRHGAKTLISVDKNKDMVMMCKKAIIQAKLSDENSKYWGTYDTIHGTFPVSKRITRSTKWTQKDNGECKQFDILISEILGTLTNSESMWTFLNHARPFIRTFKNNQVYIIPQQTETTACFYEFKDLFNSESSKYNYPMQVALDSGVIGSWKNNKYNETHINKYYVTGEIGLPLYEMNFVAATNHHILSLESYHSINFKRSIRKKGEKFLFSFINDNIPGPQTLLILEWTASLWGDIEIANTLNSYTKLSSRNRFNRNMSWGLFCYRPWFKYDKNIKFIYASINKWDIGIPMLKLSAHN